MNHKFYRPSFVSTLFSKSVLIYKENIFDPILCFEFTQKYAWDCQKHNGSFVSTWLQCHHVNGDTLASSKYFYNAIFAGIYKEGFFNQFTTQKSLVDTLRGNKQPARLFKVSLCPFLTTIYYKPFIFCVDTVCYICHSRILHMHGVRPDRK